MRFAGLLLASSLIGCTFGTDPIGDVSAASTGVPTDCWIAGNGSIDPVPGERDRFAGEAHQTAPGATTATGSWVHRSDAGDLLWGAVTVLRCRANGGFGPGDPPGSRANLSDFEGPARWNGRPGYSFIAHGEDRGAAGADVGFDFYSIDVYDPDGFNVYYAAGTLTSGNYEIYPADFVLPDPEEDECHGPRGHGRGHDEHGRGHGRGHDRHEHCDDDDRDDRHDEDRDDRHDEDDDD